MSKHMSPKKKPLKIFGKEYNDPTPKELMFLLGFVIFMIYGLILNYYAIGSSVELYTGIDKLIAIAGVFLLNRAILKFNFLGIGKDISKIMWLTLNMIGIYCVINYLDWSSVNTLGLIVFSIVGLVQLLFFSKDLDTQDTNENQTSDK